MRVGISKKRKRKAMSEEKTYKQMREEFTQKFYRKIAPELQKYDKERVNKQEIAVSVSAILILIAILIVISDFKNKTISDTNCQFSFWLFSLAIFIFWTIKKDFERKIKTLIMPTVCKCFGNLKWSCGSYKLSTIFFSTKLFDNYDFISYDDIFTGDFKDVNFEIIEAKFTKGSGKSKSTIFDGVIIKLDMNKSFNGRTVIRPNTLLHSSPSPILKHTELEDINFEKKFDVFTDDEVEARYLITPSFMERLNEMQVAFKADKVSCAFYNKYLFVALQTPEDLFSICSLFKRVDDPKQFFTMFEEILSIIKLIDHFKLDQKIGL